MGLEFLQRNTPPFLSFRNFIAAQLSWEPVSCSQESPSLVTCQSHSPKVSGDWGRLSLMKELWRWPLLSQALAVAGL